MEKEINIQKIGNSNAFPIDNGYSVRQGLNKREYIASQILSGLVGEIGSKLLTSVELDIVVDSSIKLTDKLLEKLYEPEIKP